MSLDREKEDDITLPHNNAASESSQHDVEKEAEEEAPPNAQAATVPKPGPPGPPGPSFEVPDGGLTAWLQVLGGFMVSLWPYRLKVPQPNLHPNSSSSILGATSTPSVFSKHITSLEHSSQPHRPTSRG